VPRVGFFAVITTSFVVGAIAGAGSLWLVQENRPSSFEPIAVDRPTPQPSLTIPQSSDEVIYDPSMVTIEYQVITDGMSVTHLSYVDVVDGAPVMTESLGSPPPFAHVIQLPKSDSFDLGKLSVTGMGAATSTTTTCTLKVDGEVVARQSAPGTYGLVNCSVPDGSDDT